MALSARCSPAGRLTLRRRLPEFQIDAARASLGQSVVHIRGRNVFHDVADEIFSGINAACLESGHGAVCGCELRDAQGHQDRHPATVLRRGSHNSGTLLRHPTTPDEADGHGCDSAESDALKQTRARLALEDGWNFHHIAFREGLTRYRRVPVSLMKLIVLCRVLLSSGPGGGVSEGRRV
jgi:hypothetical protein